jgi:hypothetical protein
VSKLKVESLFLVIVFGRKITPRPLKPIQRSFYALFIRS